MNSFYNLGAWLLNFNLCCPVIFAVLWVGLGSVNVAFSDHTHYPLIVSYAINVLNSNINYNKYPLKQNTNIFEAFLLTFSN